MVAYRRKTRGENVKKQKQKQKKKKKKGKKLKKELR